MNIKKKLDYRNCTVCGEKFLAGSWNAKYCNDCKVDVIAKSKYVYKKKRKK